MTDSWEPRRLGTLLKLTSGQSPSGFRFGASGTPYYKVEQLGRSDKYLNRSSTPYFSDGVPQVPRGSVLIAKRGAAIALNRIRLVTKPSFMDTNVMALTPNDEIDPEFLYYWLSHRGLWDIADVTSVPQINNKHIVPRVIPLPSLDEQRQIVAALRDFDDSADLLRRQIGKKQAVKDGMAQELLYGRTRLPGFAEPWAATRLHDVLSFEVGFPFRSESFSESASGIRLVRNRDLKSNDSPIYYTGPFADVYVVHDGDVLIGMDGDFTPCLWQGGVALLNQRVGRVRTHSCSAAFMSYALVDPLSRLEGSTGATTVKHLSHRDVESLVLGLPPVDEQVAIASVLSEADAEIDLLKLRLVKAKAIKQGMAQRLLTGRTRLQCWKPWHES